MSAVRDHFASDAARDALLLLPHQSPFRFVSAIAELEPGVRGEGVWSVIGTEDFLRGHFPDGPIVPGVLIAEALAQLSGIVWFAQGSPRGARLAQVNLKVFVAVVPPAAIMLASRLVKHWNELGMFEVTAFVQRDGERITVASGSIVLTRDAGGVDKPDEGGRL